MKSTQFIFTFVLGAGVGSALTYYKVNKMLKEKYAQYAQEEIDSIKESYGRKFPDVKIDETKQKIEADKAKNKPDISEYVSLLNKSGYTNYSNIEKKEDKTEDNIHIYISPDEYGEDDEYEQIGLTYYSDGTLADDEDEVITDAIELVGNFAAHFGDYEDDAVFVRDDDRKVYYEILADNRRYSEVLEEKPYLKED